MLLDEDGAEAIVGKSVGYWVEDSDFLSTRPGFDPREAGPHGFPRNWPSVYTKSRALKSLIGKKGKVGGTSVNVVYPPTENEHAQVAGLYLSPLQSCSNAEKVARKTGMSVEKGWAVYELLPSPGGSAGSSAAGSDAEDGQFVAQKHWFNKSLNGQPVDFTPHGPAGSGAAAVPRLLVYGTEAADKQRGTLTSALAELQRKVLLSRGFACPAPAAGAPPAKASASTRVAPPEPSKLSSGSSSSASAAKPVRRAIDYSKFDAIEDSDEEREKAKTSQVPGGIHAIPPAASAVMRVSNMLTEDITLENYRSVFQELVAKADPKDVVVPDLEKMFTAFKSCPDTTDRALLDQACHAVAGLPARTADPDGGIEVWSNSTRNMAQAMCSGMRFDECRMWCIIRRLRLPSDPQPLQQHAWCLEEQSSRAVFRGDAKVARHTFTGSKRVPLLTWHEEVHRSMRAHLERQIQVERDSNLAPHAGLVASFEKSGNIAEARKVGLEGVKKGLWSTEWQRPAMFCRGLIPGQPWHRTEDMEVCAALEQVASSIREEFERYTASGKPLPDVGARSGEALLVEQGSWKELPLFNNGRMDHEVCSQFPETVRILTERCADATGLAFCGGGEVAFRILSPGTRLKPHCGPTNARLTCLLGVSVPLGAEPGVTVATQAPRPWIDGKCVVFDDSFEHFEELDEMAEGECVVLLVHFWHPSFQHKNDPDWKVKGTVETSSADRTRGAEDQAPLFKPMSRLGSSR